MKLTMLFAGTNPRIEPLLEGAVEAEGIELEMRQVENVYYQNLHYDHLDISEMSISETLIAHERRQRFGEGKWDWSAIPIFLSRGHGWVGLYVRASSDILSLADLKGKRVGVPDYEMTQAVWMRILLKELYGIQASDISWYSLRKRGESHALELFLDAEPPTGVAVHWPTTDEDEYEMLLRGDLDAVPLPRDKVQDNPQIRRLLPDSGKQVITEFYQKTGFFQPNHHFVIQNRLLSDHPWIAQSLFQALQQSKDISYERDRRKARLDEGTGLGPELFGEDPYPLGIRAMRPTLERVIAGLSEQGLLKTPLRIEDIYDQSTLDT